MVRKTLVAQNEAFPGAGRADLCVVSSVNTNRQSAAEWGAGRCGGVRQRIQGWGPGTPVGVGKCGWGREGYSSRSEDGAQGPLW